MPVGRGRRGPLTGIDADRPTLDELVALTRTAGFAVHVADRRPPYSTEGDTVRLYVGAVRHSA